MKIVKTAKTSQNNEIILLESENLDYDKTILIIGVFHGDELEGEFLIEKYLQSAPNVVKNKLFIIPCLNPDGKVLKTRQNFSKIDLNRNFKTENWELSKDENYFGGFEPESEIETKFVVSILSQYNFDCILTLHSPYRVVNYDGPAKEVAEKLSMITGYKVEESIGYPTPGSFGTYAGIERKIPVITLELPENEGKEELWIHNKDIFEYFANEY